MRILNFRINTTYLVFEEHLPDHGASSITSRKALHPDQQHLTTNTLETYKKTDAGISTAAVGAD